ASLGVVELLKLSTAQRCRQRHTLMLRGAAWRLSVLPAIFQRPMSCTSSGGEDRGTHSRPARVRPRFYPTGVSPDDAAQEVEAGVLLEAESSDLSEQEFAASLEAAS